VQAAPHAPQLLADVEMSKQAPEQLLSVPSQAALQAPAEQTNSGAQIAPQLPQFAGSLEVSRH
jgi:hypothetical protein